MVTHLTTNPPVRCLNRAERTGSLVFNVLWSYVEEVVLYSQYILILIELTTTAVLEKRAEQIRSLVVICPVTKKAIQKRVHSII
jgi:hypothetical protein